MPMLTYITLFFILGLVFGSFANVCIHRIPKDESVVKPRSRCPECGKLIKWYDNIPILSFILLRARCRNCKSLISWRYPLVELLTGLLFSVMAWRFAFETDVMVYIVFTFLLVIVAAIDLEHKVIPDVFSFMLLLTALSYSVFNYSLGFEWRSRLFNSFFGLLAGSGSLIVFAYLGAKVFGKEAMGEGDIKLMAGIGILLGWHKTLMTLFLASLLGSIVGVSMIMSGKMNKKDYLPFGPFIAIAAYINILMPDIWE